MIVSVYLVHSLVARSPIRIGMSNKVRLPRSGAVQFLTGLRTIGSVGLVSRFGQFYKAVDPGLANVNVCTESLRVVDVKIQISPIGRQTVITRDNVNVEM